MIDPREERVRAGLNRARGQGKRLGRPPLDPNLRERIQEALKTPGRRVNTSTVQSISSGR